MRRVTSWGQVIIPSAARPLAYAKGRRVTTWRSKWFVIQDRDRWLSYWYDRLTGCWLRSVRPVGAGPMDAEYSAPYALEHCTMKRRNLSLKLVPQSELSSESKLFGKMPRLTEYLTRVTYDDGEIRTPSYFTLRNRGASFEVTLYDPDSGGRLPVNGVTLDEVFFALEKLLGAEDAPWQPDRYLLSELQKKAPKSKKK